MGWAASLGESMLHSPEWRGGSSPVKTEPLQILVVGGVAVVVVCRWLRGVVACLLLSGGLSSL